METTPRRLHPTCPKCKQNNTYDILPYIPNKPSIQTTDLVFKLREDRILGNAKYYCIDCDYTWKKYRGKKIYEQIKLIHAYAGGYPGPYFHITIDLDSEVSESEYDFGDDYLGNMPNRNNPRFRDYEWFRSELHKCDFVNWSEYYYAPICDGTHWEIKIEYENHCEIKTGSNEFPPKWKKFCKAVSKVTGGEFY